MIADCRIMFANCRMYNEEGSDIYDMANVLERVLNKTAKELGLIMEKKRQRVSGVGGAAANAQVAATPVVPQKIGVGQKVKMLYDALKDFRDGKGRQLSLIFLKLPSKHEYPDYYDIIKRPIDMEKISGKIRNNA